MTPLYFGCPSLESCILYLVSFTEPEANYEKKNDSVYKAVYCTSVDYMVSIYLSPECVMRRVIKIQNNNKKFIKRHNAVRRLQRRWRNR